MITTVGRGLSAISASTAACAWLADVSLTWIFHSATTMLVPPEGGGAGAAGCVGVEPATNVTDRKFTPPLSKLTVINCWPVPSVTGTLTVVQFCQSPVAGTETLAQTPLDPLKPRCIDPPLTDATRSCAV